MAKKSKETKKEEVKEEPKKEAPKPKAEKQTTKVWNGVGWEIVEEGDPLYKAGKQQQA